MTVQVYLQQNITSSNNKQFDLVMIDTFSTSSIDQNFITALCDDTLFKERIVAMIGQHDKKLKKGSSLSDEISNNRFEDQKSNQAHVQSLESVVANIGDILMEGYKQALFKQSNQLYNQTLVAMQQIEMIKGRLQKLQKQPNIWLTNEKAKAIRQTINNNVNEWGNDTQKEKERQKDRTKQKSGIDSSINFDLDISSQILGCKRHIDDMPMSSMSFINSFCVDGSSPIHGMYKEEDITQKINSSIQKVQTSMDQKFTALQQKVEWRIEQVKKTVQNLINMMAENDYLYQLPQQGNEKKNQRKKSSKIANNKSMEVSSLHHSYGTPQKSQIQTPANNMGGLLNKSQSKLASFFKRGN